MPVNDTNNHDPNGPVRDELHWLAFRYISGELTETEAQAFESRLESDELAQTAVARAVRLTYAVASAFEPALQPPELATALTEQLPAPAFAQRQIQKQSRWAVIVTAVSVFALCAAFWGVGALPEADNGNRNVAVSPGLSKGETNVGTDNAGPESGDGEPRAYDGGEDDADDARIVSVVDAWAKLDDGLQIEPAGDAVDVASDVVSADSGNGDGSLLSVEGDDAEAVREGEFDWVVAGLNESPDEMMMDDGPKEAP